MSMLMSKEQPGGAGPEKVTGTGVGSPDTGATNQSETLQLTAPIVNGNSIGVFGISGGQEMARLPLLTPEEEKELARRLQAGDLTARDELVTRNIRLVLHAALSYRTCGLPLDDLIQEGCIGLMRAAEKFDPARGFKFSTYASWWVRQAVSRAPLQQGRAIRLPVYVEEKLLTIKRREARLATELSRQPTADELAAAVGMTVTTLSQLFEQARPMQSLAQPVSNSNSGSTGKDAQTLGDLLSDETSMSTEEEVATMLRNEQLANLIEHLPERLQLILKLRFGFPVEHLEIAEGKPLSLEEIGRMLGGITRERVRQLEVNALGLLRTELTRLAGQDKAAI